VPCALRSRDRPRSLRALEQYGTNEQRAVVPFERFDLYFSSLDIVRQMDKWDPLRMTAVDMSGLRLSYVQFHGMDNLTSLNLADNQLMSLQNMGIEFCDKLADLDLRRNRLVPEVVHSFGCVRALRWAARCPHTRWHAQVDARLEAAVARGQHGHAGLPSQRRVRDALSARHQPLAWAPGARWVRARSLRSARSVRGPPPSDAWFSRSKRVAVSERARAFVQFTPKVDPTTAGIVLYDYVLFERFGHKQMRTGDFVSKFVRLELKDVELPVVDVARYPSLAVLCLVGCKLRSLVGVGRLNKYEMRCDAMRCVPPLTLPSRLVVLDVSGNPDLGLIDTLDAVAQNVACTELQQLHIEASADGGAAKTAAKRRADALKLVKRCPKLWTIDHVRARARARAAAPSRQRLTRAVVVQTPIKLNEFVSTWSADMRASEVPDYRFHLAVVMCVVPVRSACLLQRAPALTCWRAALHRRASAAIIPPTSRSASSTTRSRWRRCAAWQTAISCRPHASTLRAWRRATLSDAHAYVRFATHSFSAFQNLRELNLAGNHITDILAMRLHLLPNLRLLDLHDNDIDSDVSSVRTSASALRACPRRNARVCGSAVGERARPLPGARVHCVARQPRDCEQARALRHSQWRAQAGQHQLPASHRRHRDQPRRARAPRARHREERAPPALRARDRRALHAGRQRDGAARGRARPHRHAPRAGRLPLVDRARDAAPRAQHVREHGYARAHTLMCDARVRASDHASFARAGRRDVLTQRARAANILGLSYCKRLKYLDLRNNQLREPAEVIDVRLRARASAGALVCVCVCVLHECVCGVCVLRCVYVRVHVYVCVHVRPRVLVCMCARVRARVC
jgi:hypothetical protein